MRDIKFRAWSKNKMLKDANLHHGKLSWIGEDGSLCFSVLPSVDEAILMQFIGLQDAKGIDIYEGDIISISDYDDGDHYFTGQVMFGVRGYPAFDVYDSKNEAYCDEYNTLTNDNLSFEVIGNIHENPEIILK